MYFKFRKTCRCGNSLKNKVKHAVSQGQNALISSFSITTRLLRNCARGRFGINMSPITSILRNLWAWCLGPRSHRRKSILGCQGKWAWV